MNFKRSHLIKIFYDPQEMNGNSKFSTLQSPFAQTDKSFYNPFAVDLSLDNINPPMTSTYITKKRTITCTIILISI